MSPTKAAAAALAHPHEVHEALFTLKGLAPILAADLESAAESLDVDELSPAALARLVLREAEKLTAEHDDEDDATDPEPPAAVAG